MTKLFVLIVCVVGLVSDSVNGDLVDNLIEKLLQDPHSREIIEETKVKLDQQTSPKDAVSTATSAGTSKDSVPPSLTRGSIRGGDALKPPGGKFGSIRGGDALKPPGGKFGSIRGGDALKPPGGKFGSIRGGDSKSADSPSLDDLLVQLKSSIQDTLDQEKSSKENHPPPLTENIPPPSRKELVPPRNDAIEKVNAPPLGFPWADSQPQNNWIPWKRTSSSASLVEKKLLYKRIINNINELFAMTTNDATNNEEYKGDKLSSDLSTLVKTT